MKHENQGTRKAPTGRTAAKARVFVSKALGNWECKYKDKHKYNEKYEDKYKDKDNLGSWECTVQSDKSSVSW